MTDPDFIEMKTIRTNIVSPKIPAFKLLMDTRCVKINDKGKYRYTSVILKKEEFCWGNLIVNKSRIYIDVTECFKCKKDTERVCIPVMFDMCSKYMINVCEHNEPIYF
jgi:hypothetical protein